jgi:hypothetical protein
MCLFLGSPLTPLSIYHKEIKFLWNRRNVIEDELSKKTDTRVIIQNLNGGVRKTPRSKGMVNLHSVLK